MLIRQDNYSTGGDTFERYYSAVWLAQTFTPATAYKLGSVALWAFGRTADVTQVSLYATSGGLPTTLIETLTRVGAMFTSWDWWEYTSTANTQLNAGTKYAIVVHKTTGTWSSGYGGWYADVSSPGYAGGSLCSSADSGTLWSATTGTDMYFEVWGCSTTITAPKDGYHYYDDNTKAVYDATWLCQIVTPLTSYSLNSVNLLLAKLGAPSGTLTLSVYATDGVTHKPTGGALTSASIDYSGLGTSYPGTEVSPAFSSALPLTAGVQYALVLALSAGNSSNAIRMTYRMNGSYAGGQILVSIDSGINWTTDNGDFAFELNASGIKVISPTIAGTGTVTMSPVAGIPVDIALTGDYPVLAQRPEAPLVECLQFSTQVHRRLNGTEQRIALRKCPRHVFELNITDQRQWMESYLYDRAMDGMSVPYWHESVFLTTAVAPGDDHAHVTSTAYSQFLAGYWAMLIKVDGTFDTVKVASVSDAQISFDGVAMRSMPVGAEIIPVYPAWADSINVSKQYRYTLYDLKAQVSPVDNDLGLTPYYDGELSITDVNYAVPQQETITRPFYRNDGGYGLISQTVILSHSDKGSMLSFRTRNRADLWALRQKLYRLQGRARAFWLSTFSEELTPNATLTASQSVLDIERCGYTEFVQDRRAELRVHLTSGVVLSRTVLASQIIDGATERLTVDAAWPYTIQVTEVEKIDYLDFVRLDSDDIVIRHINALGWASCDVPVVHAYSPVIEPGIPE